jgi:hypothetical protein
MAEPWIGDENTDAPGQCTYASKPGQPQCGAPATLHVMSESAIYGAVALVACDVHASIARDAGPFLGEHPYTVNCSGRVSWWRLDGCSPDSGPAS